MYPMIDTGQGVIRRQCQWRLDARPKDIANMPMRTIPKQSQDGNHELILEHIVTSMSITAVEKTHLFT
jgi:hypothetical protein